MACTADITAEVVSDKIVLDALRKNLQIGLFHCRRYIITTHPQQSQLDVPEQFTVS
jgi:hypothetical protein